MSGWRLDDDGGPEVVFIEDGDDPASLWVRVGPVFDGDDIRKEPGVWIDYQERHYKSELHGPVLMTPAAWRKLNRAVMRRLRRRSRWLRGTY